MKTAHHQALLSYGGTGPRISPEYILVATSAVDTPPFLGDDNNLWFEGFSNTARRYNVISGALAETYSIASFGFAPAGERFSNGRVTFYNAGGAFGLFGVAGDGSYQLYTGAPSMMGVAVSNDIPSRSWNSDGTRGIAKGDSVSGSRLYYFEQDNSAFTINETLVYSAGDLNLFGNAANAISNKGFFNKSTSTIAYVDLTSGTVTDIITGLTINLAGHLVTPAGDLWTAVNGTPATVQKRDEGDGTVVDSVTLPSGNNSIVRLYDDPDGRIWAVSNKMVCIDPSTVEVITESSNTVSSKFPLGFTGRSFVFWHASGGNLWISIMEV